MQPVLLKLLGPFRGKFPSHAVLGKLLQGRPQLGLVQGEIIHAPEAQDTHARESPTNTIHERAARGTEVVGHRVVLARGFHEDGTRLTEGLQEITTTKVL